MSNDHDWARVLGILRDAGGDERSTLSIAASAGFPESHPMGSDGRARALRTLRRLEAAGHVAMRERYPGVYYWRELRGELYPYREGDAISIATARAVAADVARELEHKPRSDAAAYRKDLNPDADKPVCQGGPRWYV
jgi:hypothetical protein